MDTRHTSNLPTMTGERSGRRRTLLGIVIVGVVAAAAIATGTAGGGHNVRAAGGAEPQPIYPYPPAPYPYPCYPPCPRIIVYPSGCATPFAPPPPEFTPIPGGPGATPPAPPPPLPLQAAPLQAVPLQAPPIPSPTPGGVAAGLEYKVCPQKEFDIPKVIQVQAAAEPWTIYGYGMKRNPNVPYHPMFNSYRHWLSTQNMNMPYSVCNPAIWKAGCP